MNYSRSIESLVHRHFLVGKRGAITGALVLSFVLIACVCNSPTRAEEATSRTVPSRVIPVASSVSPQLQKLLGEPENPTPSPPKTADDWTALRKQSAASDEATGEELAKLHHPFGVTVIPEMMAGVRCFVVTPGNIKPRNRNRLILNMHPGGFIGGRGESGTWWAITLAGVTGYKVVVVDYRLLPDDPFPAAMDDATMVWKHLIRSKKSANIAVVGASVGGGMALSLVQRAKLEGLPPPGAVVSISPAAADLSKTGDTWYTNAGVDGSIAYDGFWEAVFKFYANGHDLRDPALSPIYGDFKGFPPTYLVTGTRDVFLSDTVRVQRRLLQAGVPTQLVVVEGAPHGGLTDADIPEVADVYRSIAQFLDAHLRD